MKTIEQYYLDNLKLYKVPESALGLEHSDRNFGRKNKFTLYQVLFTLNVTRQ